MKKRLRRENGRKVALSRRLYAAVAAVLLLVMVLIITATYEGLDYIYLIHGAIQAAWASREIEDVINGSPDDFAEEMDAIELNYIITVELTDPRGVLVYASDFKGRFSTPPYGSGSIALPESERRQYTEDASLGENNGTSYSVGTIAAGSRDLNYIRFEKKLGNGADITIYKLRSDADSAARIAVAFISIVTVLVAFAALVLIVLFIRRSTKPLEEMGTVTKNMSQLDFSRKCEDSNIEEISVLAESINEMSDSLENALSDLRAKNAKLQLDYEQEKTIEQLREVFISGMSHELKTPIAIIQGYAEGLGMFIEEGDLDTAKEYCDTIVTEADRMNTLVMKLLEISRYQSGAYEPVYERVDIRSVVSEWFARNEKKLADMGITAVNDIPEGTALSCDRTLVATIVNNYLSNAVSHADGDKVIRASAARGDKGVVRVSVFNTGAQIAEKDITKIWDSFYRADKSLSRSQGRFGLGLSIVAAIQKMHGMDFGVLNHAHGVEFWFEEAEFSS